MCKFFSCLSDKDGKIYYFTPKQREEIKVFPNKIYEFQPDSHSSIAEYYGLNEDRCNKWEYNPITKTLVEDTINTTKRRLEVLDKVKAIKFKRYKEYEEFVAKDKLKAKLKPGVRFKLGCNSCIIEEINGDIVSFTTTFSPTNQIYIDDLAQMARFELT